MKKSALILLLAVPMVFASCSTSKFFSQKASDIRPIALVESYSYITDAVADFSTDYLPEASRLNQLLVTDIVNTLGMPIEKTVSVNFDAANRMSKLGSWMHNLIDLSPNSAKNLVVPSEIRDAVRQSGCQYGLLIADVGYSKNANQYAFEKGIETATKIADIIINGSLDLSDETEAYVNGVFALVFDNQTGQVVWYGSRPRRYEYNPLDRQSLTKQLTKLFAAFQYMIHYPVKILMAFGCSFEPEGEEFFEWLMRNGYPELGALSHTIQGDTKAKDWLMEHNFPQLAAIDSVIDKETKAEEWLLRNHFEVNLAFAKAINRDDEATDWLEKNELQVFIVIADKIRKYLDDKYLDYHKIHF